MLVAVVWMVGHGIFWNSAVVVVGLFWGGIGIMEEKMETTIAYWDYRGIMEKKMEPTHASKASGSALQL